MQVHVPALPHSVQEHSSLGVPYFKQVPQQLLTILGRGLSFSYALGTNILWIQVHLYLKHGSWRIKIFWQTVSQKYSWLLPCCTASHSAQYWFVVITRLHSSVVSCYNCQLCGAGTVFSVGIYTGQSNTVLALGMKFQLFLPLKCWPTLVIGCTTILPYRTRSHMGQVINESIVFNKVQQLFVSNTKQHTICHN